MRALCLSRGPVWLLGLWLASAAATELRAQTAATSTQDHPILVLEIEGKVEVLRAGAAVWDPSYTNQVLQAGDQLRTGERSRVAIRLSNLSITRLPELSHLQIPPRKRGFNLLRGILYFFHRDRPGEMELRSRVVNAVVRGTEFVFEVADDGTTTLSLLNGEVEMGNEFGQLILRSGEAGTVAPGQAPRRTAMLPAENLLQWFLYYPGVLDSDELQLPDAEQQALRESLDAYRSGDLLGALAKYPAGRQPASDAERVYLGALLLSVGLVDKAEAQLATVSKDGAQAERLGRLVPALRKLIAAVKGPVDRGAAGRVSPSAPPEPPASGELTLTTEWLAESYSRQSRSELELALRAARRAAETSPRFGFAWVRVAELEFGFGRVLAAREALERGLQLAPRNAQALALRGFLLSAQNRIAEAIAAFDQAIALDGALGNAWLGRGLCKIRRGQREAGREDLQVAASIEPQRAVLRSYLGKAFSNAGDLARARKELGLAKELDPNDPTAWLYSALLNQQEGRINEAVRDLEKSQVLNRNRSVYRSRLLLDQDRAVRSANLANLYRDAGMTDVSFREAARAVEADYANYSAHFFLANSFNELRDARQVNLRFETPWLSEYLVANLLAPVGAGTLSQRVSQQEYSRLFEGDRLGLVSTTEYLSRGDWLQSGVQYGTYRDVGYAVEATYLSQNGQRANNDQEQLTLSGQFKLQLTPRDTFYLQTIYYDAEGGDLRQLYDPTAAFAQGGPNRSLRFEENQEPLLLAGYHHEWSPGTHTLALASRLQDTFQLVNPTQPVVIQDKRTPGVVPDALSLAVDLQKYRSELEIYSAEAQHIWAHADHTLIAGARYQTGEFDTENDIAGFGLFGFNSAPAVSQDFSPDFERVAAYGYWHWQILEPLLLIGGVSYDRLEFPVNHRSPPVSADEETRDRVSPKAGFIATLARGTTVRGAYTRSLGGVSFDQSFQLEPSQVAGFNQSFRSLIPESAGGSVPGAPFESWGLALDQKFPTGTYLGVSGEVLKSKTDRQVGAYDIVTTEIMPGVFDDTFVPSGTQQDLDYHENTLTVTLNQLLGNEWSVGARYRVSNADLDGRFTDISAAPVTPSGLITDSELEATLHQVNLFVIYNHPSGFFGQFQSLWTRQSNQGYATPLEGDDFWQFNAFVGYRFPRRRAELTLGLLNIGDQDYRLNPLNLTTELPRDRTLVVNLRFNFW
jgi:tetratricopeptide (TPR) repeat protein